MLKASLPRGITRARRPAWLGGRAHLALFALSLQPAIAEAQQPGAAPAVAPTRAAIIAAARQVISTARYATLATMGERAQPMSRVVDPLGPDADLIIWVGTNPLTRKVEEIQRNGRVSLLYFDARGLEYAMVLGDATIVTDRAVKARHWKPEWAPFYKNGSQGDDFALIRVRPRRIEVVSPSHKLMNDPRTWRPQGVDIP